jgi:phage regulator Rha-like protein
MTFKEQLFEKFEQMRHENQDISTDAEEAAQSIGIPIEDNDMDFLEHR